MAEAPRGLEALPPPMRKHADPAAPMPLRMMGAKALVPAAAPSDLVRLLHLLGTGDADANVRATAERTTAGLPERIFGPALRDGDLGGEVLDWLADRMAGVDQALELLLLNPSALDGTVARLAATVPQQLAELVRQNELRLLRHDDIVRQLCRNPSALASTIDGACELCVRNGLTLLDVPQLVAAHQRVYGVDPTAKPEDETAAGLMAEYAEELASDAGAAPHEESPEEAQKKLTMTQRVARMSVSEKIKLATLGNKEARTLLLRDPNKLVCMAAITSPRITDGEVMTLANSRTANADVLRHIYTSRDYLKNYGIKIALVKNPKVPLPTALKFLQTLQEKDIRELSRDRNVPQTVQAQAKAWVMKREAAARGPAMGKH